MFGRNRRLATEHTINAVRPVIAIVQHSQGLPPRFWQDDFVLGFVGFLIGFHANYTSGRRLSQEEKGLLTYDVFGALSNMNGQEIGRNFTRLSTLTEKNHDFELGGDNAAICAFASIGKMNDQGRPYYEKAKEIAKAQGNQGDLGAVVAILMHQLFYDPLNERFPK